MKDIILLLLAYTGMSRSGVDDSVKCPDANIFLADEYDCYIFYRCVGGRRYQFSCPPGTLYDSRIMVCNWPKEVGDCDENGKRTDVDSNPDHLLPPAPPGGSWSKERFACPDNDGFYPHPSDCRLFYRCVAGRPYQFTCASGTFFDPTAGVCNFPLRVPGCDARGNRYGDIGPPSGGTNKKIPGTLACPVKYGIFPHPFSCSQFIYCSNYSGLFFSCPRGLFFDRVRLLCDFRKKVLCSTGPY